MNAGYEVWHEVEQEQRVIESQYAKELRFLVNLSAIILPTQIT